MNIFDLFGSVRLEGLNTVTSGLGELNSLVNNVGSSMVKIGDGISNFGSMLYDNVSKPIMELTKSGIQYNMTMEDLSTSFEVLLGSATKSADLMGKLKKMSAETPFDTQGLATYTQKLLAMGYAENEVIGVMSRLGDVSLGNSAKMGTLIDAMGKAKAMGKLQGQELNRLQDQGFTPLQIIMAKTGETMDQVRERMKNGEISYKELEATLVSATSEGGRFFKGMEKGSQTLSGKLSTLKDNFDMLLGDATKPLFDFIKSVAVPTLTKLTESFNKLSPDTKKFLEVLAVASVLLPPLIILFGSIVSAIGGLVVVASIISPVSILVGLIAGLASAVGGFMALGGFAGILASFKFADFSQIKNIFESIKNKAMEVKNWLFDIWSPAIDYILTGNDRSLAKIDDAEFKVSLEGIRSDLLEASERIKDFFTDAKIAVDGLDKSKIQSLSNVIADLVDKATTGTTFILDFIDTIKDLVYWIKRAGMISEIAQDSIPMIGDMRRGLKTEMEMFSADIKHYNDEEWELNRKIRITQNIEEKTKLETELKELKEKQKTALEDYTNSEETYIKKYGIDADIIDTIAKGKITASNSELQILADTKVNPPVKQYSVDASIDPLQAYGKIQQSNADIQQKADEKIKDVNKQYKVDASIDPLQAYGKIFASNSDIQQKADEKIKDPTKKITVNADVNSQPAKSAISSAFDAIKSFANDYVFNPVKKFINFIVEPVTTKNVPKFATGVRNFGGGMAIVGERGPELVHLPTGSNVYTANETRQMLKSSTSKSINGNAETNIFNVTIDAKNVKDFNDVLSFFKNVKVEAITRRGY